MIVLEFFEQGMVCLGRDQMIDHIHSSGKQNFDSGLCGGIPVAGRSGSHHVRIRQKNRRQASSCKRFESRSVLCHLESTWRQHLPGCCLSVSANVAQRGAGLGVMCLAALFFACQRAIGSHFWLPEANINWRPIC